MNAVVVGRPSPSRARALLALALTAALAIAALADEASVCLSTMLTEGYTVPSGDISLLVGSDLEIRCHLDPRKSDANASAILFFRNDLPLSPSPPGVEIVVESATSARLLVRNLRASDDMYYCKVRGADGRIRGVCLNTVVVDEPPRNVTDFDCVSNNWQNLTCSWTPPRNYLNTTYSLYYLLNGRAGRRIKHRCSEMRIEPDDRRSCFWNLSTESPYRQAYDEYSFYLNGSNKFGDTVQEIKFDHYAHVKPAPPDSLRLADVRSDGATLEWTEHYSIRHFTVPLVHRVSVCSELDACAAWTTTILANEKNGATHSFELRGLFPNVRYDARVSSKPETAGDPLWSDHSAITFKTRSARPLAAPLIERGAFESIPEVGARKVYVWWRRIERRLEGGENFTYAIVDATAGGREFLVDRYSVRKSHVAIERLPLGEVELAFASSNAVGLSEERARIRIPAQADVLPEPKYFTKIEFNNGTYELSWGRVVHPELEGYTIFWCDNRRERPYSCEGSLAWKRVPANATLAYVTIPDDDGGGPRSEIYHFAISADGRRSSSGMVWALCSVIPNKSLSRMRNVWINRVGSTYIEVGWELECSDRIGAVLGYEIAYCPVVSLYNTTCKEERRSLNVTREEFELNTNVTGLRPHTTYSISVAVVTKYAVGRPSKPLYNLTSEGAPTPPRNVTVADLRNDRMLVSWSAPAAMNGYLKYYLIEYRSGPDGRGESVVVEKKDGDAERAEGLLTNLSGYTAYDVRVKACTVACSEPSESLIVRTAIGAPGEVRPRLRGANASREKELRWEPPERRGGDSTRYQVRLVARYGDDRNRTEIFNTTAESFPIRGDLCLDERLTSFCYSVRAVNVDDAPDHGAAALNRPEAVRIRLRPPGDEGPIAFEGPWNGDLCSDCVSVVSDVWIYFVVFLATLAVLLYALRKLWVYCKNMQNIKPCLPPGLGGDIDKDPGTKRPLGKKHKDDEKLGRPTLADSESLLNGGLGVRDATVFDGGGDGGDGGDRGESSDGTVVLSLASSDRGVPDELEGARDGSETASADSSIRWRNVGSPASRPTSATSLARSDETPKMTPYSTVGVLVDDSPKSDGGNKGYVSLGALTGGDPAFAPARRTPVETVPVPVPVPRPVVPERRAPVQEPASGYVMNAIAIPARAADLVRDAPSEGDRDRSPFARLLNEGENAPIAPILSNSGYVMRDDSAIANGVDESRPRKALDAAPSPRKRTTPSDVAVPAEGALEADAALSPEAYCRFGPNTNVPQRFDFRRADGETANGLLASAKSADDYDYERYGEPPRGDSSVPPSHYVPLNVRGVNEL